MAQHKRLRIFRHDVEVSDDAELRNGRAWPSGYSQHEIFAPDDWGQMVKIGNLIAGYPSDFIEGFTFTIEDIPRDSDEARELDEAHMGMRQ